MLERQVKTIGPIVGGVHLVSRDQVGFEIGQDLLMIFDNQDCGGVRRGGGMIGRPTR